MHSGSRMNSKVFARTFFSIAKTTLDRLTDRSVLDATDAAPRHGLLLERMDPRDLTGSGLRTALQLGVLLQELPLQASQTLMDLERGNLQVRIVSEELDRLEHHLRGLGMTVFGGLLASALTLGGIYVLARYEATFMGVPILPAVAFLGAGAMFGVAFFWFLTGGRLPKVSLASLVRGRGRRRRRRDDA